MVGGDDSEPSLAPSIEDADEIVRFIKAPSHLTWDARDGKYVVSDQAFAAMQGGVSVELTKLYAANTNLAQRAASHQAIGALALDVGSVRRVPQFNQNGKAIENKFLDVTYTPDQPD